MEKKSILIVDDEPDMLKVVEAGLKANGYDVITAMDGEAGLAAAISLKPDLIILDLKLPKLAGLEVCRAIREDRDKAYGPTPFSCTPIIMMTGKGDDVDRVIGKVVGANHYFTKPFEYEVLLAKIKELLSVDQSVNLKKQSWRKKK